MQRQSSAKMQPFNCERTGSRKVLRGSFQWNGLKRTIVLRWCQLYAVGCRFLERQRRKQRKLVAVLRSLYGHICNQAATDREACWYGFASVIRPDGFLGMNIHAYARMIYTEKLRASLPWIDSLDRQIFLMGFDAGAQFQVRTGTESYSQNEGYVPWITSEVADDIWDNLTEASLKFSANLLPSKPDPRSPLPSQK